jgi:hypothetical protein
MHVNKIIIGTTSQSAIYSIQTHQTLYPFTQYFFETERSPHLVYFHSFVDRIHIEQIKAIVQQSIWILGMLHTKMFSGKEEQKLKS